MSDKVGDKLNLFRDAVEDILSRQETVTSSELQQASGKSASTVKRYLAEMVADGYLVAEGGNKSRRYRKTV